LTCNSVFRIFYSSKNGKNNMIEEVCDGREI
jgi:hypothetical protein